MTALCHRLFFAFLPPPLARNRIGWHRDQLDQGSSPVRNDRLHMTLGITRDYERLPDDVARRMLAIGDAVGAAPVRIVLDRLSGSNRSIALRPGRRSAGLAALDGELGPALGRQGLLRPDWSFSPHVTLLYRDGRPFTRTIEAIAWDAAELVLIHSVVGETRHIELGRWRLASRQGSFGF